MVHQEFEARCGTLQGMDAWLGLRVHVALGLGVPGLAVREELMVMEGVGVALAEGGVWVRVNPSVTLSGKNGTEQKAKKNTGGGNERCVIL